MAVVASLAIYTTLNVFTFTSFRFLNTDLVFAGWGARRTHGAILPLAFSSAEVPAEHIYANRHGFTLPSDAMLPDSS